MTALVYLVEYKSFGGRKLGGPDDVGGVLPQYPGQLSVNPQELSVTTGTSVTLHPDTTFIEFQTYDADVLFNYDSGGHATIDTTNQNRLTPGQVRYQGVVGNRTKDQIITTINFKETV